MYAEDMPSSKVSIETTQCLQHHQGKTVLMSLRTCGVGKTATALVTERFAKDMEKDSNGKHRSLLSTSISRDHLYVLMSGRPKTLCLLYADMKGGRCEKAQTRCLILAMMPREPQSSEPQPSEPSHLPLGTRHTTAATVSSTRHSGCALIRQFRRNFAAS